MNMSTSQEVMGGPVTFGFTAPATTYQHVAADSRNGLAKDSIDPEATPAAVSLSGNTCEPVSYTHLTLPTILRV